MQNTEVFHNMVLRMVTIGEESGALDPMLGKVCFCEGEVYDAVEAPFILMEPIIMVVLWPPDRRLSNRHVPADIQEWPSSLKDRLRSK